MLSGAERFETKLAVIALSGAPLDKRLEGVSAAYHDSIKDYVISGDDMMLGKLRNLAADCVEKMALAGASGASTTRIGEIEAMVNGITWLPDGFRSSIGAGLAFARANARD